jgi:hypothetical protein
MPFKMLCAAVRRHHILDMHLDLTGRAACEYYWPARNARATKKAPL